LGRGSTGKRRDAPAPGAWIGDAPAPGAWIGDVGARALMNSTVWDVMTRMPSLRG
jgi:hypothetical protein